MNEIVQLSSRFVFCICIDRRKMAILWCTLESLCLLFVVFVGISSVSSATDYHYYDVDTPHPISECSLELLHDKGLAHTYSKRDVSTNLAPLPPVDTRNISAAANVTELPSTVIPQRNSSITEEISVTPSKKKFNTKLEKAPGTYSTANFTKIALKNIKNLGENGTGIRKNFTLNVPQPSLVHSISEDNDKSNETAEDDDDDDAGLSIPRYPSDIDTEEGGKKFNETLKNHNITNSKTDPNLFYNSTISNDTKIGQYYWVNLTNRSDVKVNELLSKSHRRAATIRLSFEFPFYGHLIKNVTIATGGFLYTGDYVHSWLAATQYIAPLMANFDTSLSNDSFIKYLDNGTAFTVEWEKVNLQDKPDDGEFTFQVTLFRNGDIVFVYQNIPLLVHEIEELHHPVKVGLSDAYIMDQTVFLVRRKTIYEYDRVNFNKTHIRNWTSIYIKALPTCLDSHDCTTCLTKKISFQCNWCPSMNKCSEGFDRYRQNWLEQGCHKSSFTNATMCSIGREYPIFDSDSSYNADSNLFENEDGISKLPEAYAGKIRGVRKGEKIGVSGIIAILFLVAMVSGLTFWTFYAYRNPHTTSGQILIRYRPSQWRWRRGEARYTAATIHM